MARLVADGYLSFRQPGPGMTLNDDTAGAPVSAAALQPVSADRQQRQAKPVS